MLKALTNSRFHPAVSLTALLSFALTACSPSLTAEEALTMPLECPSFIDAAVFDGEAGEGYAAAQEAFDALDTIEKPAGDIRFVVEAEGNTTWIYFIENAKVGEVHARKTEWGLWVIERVERCIFDYFPISPAP